MTKKQLESDIVTDIKNLEQSLEYRFPEDPVNQYDTVIKLILR